MKRYNLSWFILATICASNWITITNSQPCEINDKEIKRSQWYLKRLNVLPAWRSCVNGSGVTVAVVDTGVQNHIDLDIDRTLDGGVVQVNSNRRRWFQVNPNNILKHGTRVAGIIAAKRDGHGPIGIAFGARVADIRIASKGVFDTFDAGLLNHRSDVIDVYSCSFANFHTGTKSYPLLPSQEHAFEIGTSLGRNGLGSVYVFGTGNSGGKRKDIFRDSCAYDRLVTNRYVISVAGIRANYKRVQNGEECSAMMVAAFTAYAGSGRKLLTTDINNATTKHFNMNSAAVPMVSGAVALALSENPSLGYRDVMHLLVNTSRSDIVYHQKKSSFITNGAGLNVSSVFGFGILDIGKLVERAKNWKNVLNLKNCTTEEIYNIPLYNKSNYLLMNVTGCNVEYVEHVEVTLNLSHPHAGQIKWVLISPYGTESVILPGRILDPTMLMNITVLSVQMWGENPNGYWRLEPKAQFDTYLDGGTLYSAYLTVYGTSCEDLQCLPPAKQSIQSWSAWSSWSKCSVTCGRGKQFQQRRCRNRQNPKGICFGRSTEMKECGDSEECPKQSENINSKRCPSSNTLRNSCVEECSLTDNTGCLEDKVCCYNGCGHTCEIPIPLMETTVVPPTADEVMETTVVPATTDKVMETTVVPATTDKVRR